MDLSTLSDAELMRLYQAPQNPLSAMSDDELMKAYEATDTVKDTAKSLGIGLAKGAIDLYGLPGDAQELVRHGINWGAKKLGSEGDVLPNPFNTFPTSEKIKSGVESFTGEFYKPKTMPGEYASTIGQFLPASALGPGRVIPNMLKFGLAPALTSETAGQLTKDTPAEPYARAGTALATGGLAALLSRPQSAVREAGPAMASSEFNIPLSRGQELGDLKTIQAEQAALRGQKSNQAQTQAQDFFEQQRVATEAARANVGRQFDPSGRQLVNTAPEAAEVAQSALQRAAADQKQLYGTLYDNVAQAPGEFKPWAFQDVASRIAAKLPTGAQPIVVDQVTTPWAAKALDDLKTSMQPTGTPGNFGANLIGLDMKAVDQARKRLNVFYQNAKTNPADKRAISGIIGALDDEVETAITRGLFSGDKATLEALRDARAEFTRYRQLYTKQGPSDTVGADMARIVKGIGDAPATAEQVANYIYGSGIVGKSGNNVSLAYRVRNILGDKSPEWSGIRQGIWSRLTAPIEGNVPSGPDAIAKRINEFVSGPNRTLANFMFSPQEREVMTAFSRALREQATPQAGANWSNTATFMTRFGPAVEQVGNMLMSGMGYAAAGLPGALAMMGLAVGKKLASAVKEQRQVGRSFYSQPSSNALPRAAIAGSIGYQTGTNR